MEYMQRICHEYWKLVKGRFGDRPITREALKESIVTYDVKKENGYKGDDWERMCNYKIAETDGFDCDVAYLTMLQYAIAFPYVLRNGREIREQGSSKLKYEIGNAKDSQLFWFRGDTMNSYATVIREFIRQFGPYGRSYEPYQSWDDRILKNYSAFSDLLPSEAKTYIGLNHTIGNFVPVPVVENGPEFNSPRGCGNTKEFWDLALFAIYEWYTKQNDEKLKEMLQNSVENTELCKNWLKCFPTWPDFVRANYMEPFVHANYGEPKELWKGHFTPFINGPFWWTLAMPNTLEQFSEFFINASDWIWERGIMIAEVIMQELEKAPGCHPWKEDD